MNIKHIDDTKKAIDQMSEIIDYAYQMRAALEQIANSPIPYNSLELDIWYQTARNIASSALKIKNINDDE